MELVADQFQLTIVLFFTIFLLLAFNQAQNVTYCVEFGLWRIIEYYTVSDSPSLYVPVASLQDLGALFYFSEISSPDVQAFYTCSLIA
ncbi:hypothetical protein QQP08_026645 [Theobroma cacao]|nr:hypothetical protein QQP08_026645 [Theobroma cacao]